MQKLWCCNRAGQMKTVRRISLILRFLYEKDIAGCGMLVPLSWPPTGALGENN
jgi:hypothetical protein